MKKIATIFKKGGKKNNNCGNQMHNMEKNI